MSDISITIERILSVEVHPGADKLEIAKILGTQVVVPLGQYRAGQHVVYFPPDMLIPLHISEELGVQKYLKHSILGGQRIACRVAACRLRSAPSYGFISQVPDEIDHRVGSDVTN